MDLFLNDWVKANIPVTFWDWVANNLKDFICMD